MNYESIEQNFNELMSSNLKKTNVDSFKSKTNREMEKFWDQEISKKCLGLTEDSLVSELYWINKPMLHTVGSAQKKINKIRKDFPDNQYVHMLDKADEILGSFKVLVEYHDKLKDALKNKPVVEKKKAPETADQVVQSLPPASRASIKRVKDMLDKKCEGLKNSLEERYLDQFNSYLDDFMELDKKDRSSVRLYRKYVGREDVLGLVRRWTQNGEILPDAQDSMKKMATDSAQLVVDKYVFKQTAKLAGIVEKMGKIDAIQLNIGTDGGNIEGKMKLAFNDGRSFDLNSQVVISVNSNGTWYERYPSTFHNITEKNGDLTAKMMSEHEMHSWAEGRNINEPGMEM